MHLKIITALTLLFVCLSSLAGQDAVTYTKDISPIIYNNCTVCHREGEIGPFPLTNFEEVRGEAYTILSVTRKGTMPPWMPDREFSNFEFLGERGLTDQEIETIAQWIETGMPEGDPTFEAPMPKFVEGSALGEPDLTLRVDEPYQIKGSNEDEYRVFVLPTGLTEDRDLVGVEFRPGNRTILHHGLLAFDTTGQAREIDASDPLVGYEVFGGFGIPINPQAQLPGYTPGAVPLRLPKGVGIKLPAGADILMQTHYAPWPVRDSDQSGVNLFFADEPVERYLKTRQMMPFDLVEEDTLQPPTLNLSERLEVVGELIEEFGQNRLVEPGNGAIGGDIADRLGEGFGGRLEGWSLFKIPPDKVSRFHGIWKVEDDISLISIYPHMHLLGKGWEIYAIDPEGNRENLLKIDSWDFNWQGDYPLPKYVKIDKGSVIHATATYDNTVDNYVNPNMPPKASGWGGKTTDEMYLLGFNYVDYQEDDENTFFTLSDPKPSEPVILRPPASNRVPTGGRAQFFFEPEGVVDSIQWFKDGAEIPGATAATLVLQDVSAADEGAYSVRITNGSGSAVSAAGSLAIGDEAAAELVNLATRGFVGTGTDIMIGGVTVLGESTKTVLVRGLGPQLTADGVPGALEDPELRVFKTLYDESPIRSQLLVTNDNWEGGPNAAELAEALTEQNKPLMAGSKDAALLLTLSQGVYTFQLSGVAETEGVGLIELFVIAETNS